MAEVVTCPACRAGQLKRRGDPLCSPCASAAREAAPRPSWALDSPVLRRSLATVNVPAVVAVVRAACGLSQRDMADVAGWTPAVLSYYERGRRAALYDVRVVLQFADAVGMPRAALLALVLGDPNASERTTAGTPPLEHPVTDSRLRYWQACADALRERERMAGGTTLLSPALLLYRQAAEAAHRSPSARATAAGIALFAAEAALDSSDIPQATRLAAIASDLSCHVGDPLLTAHVLLVRSGLLATITENNGTRDPARQALLMAREAADEARYELVPQLHALIAIAHARAAALLGDAPAFDTAITRARRELARPAPAIPVLAWLRNVGMAEITAADAQGSKALSRTSSALLLYRQALDAASCPRDRALLGTQLATTLLATGDRDGAVNAALEIALPTLESGVISVVCVEWLHHVVMDVDATPGALELRTRIDALKLQLPGTDTPGLVTRPALVAVSA